MVIKPVFQVCYKNTMVNEILTTLSRYKKCLGKRIVSDLLKLHPPNIQVQRSCLSTMAEAPDQFIDHI